MLSLAKEDVDGKSVVPRNPWIPELWCVLPHGRQSFCLLGSLGSLGQANRIKLSNLGEVLGFRFFFGTEAGRESTSRHYYSNTLQLLKYKLYRNTGL